MFEIELTRRETAAVATVTARGTLDSRGAENLETMLDMAAQSRRVVLDLGSAFLVDAAGLRALIGGMRRVRDAGGTVELVATPVVSSSLRERWSQTVARW